MFVNINLKLTIVDYVSQVRVVFVCLNNKYVPYFANFNVRYLYV
jgi:hypothetical protein